MADPQSKLIRNCIPQKAEEFNATFENFLVLKGKGIDFIEPEYIDIWNLLSQAFNEKGKLPSKESLEIQLAQKQMPEHVAVLDLVFRENPDLCDSKNFESLADTQKDLEDKHRIRVLISNVAEITKSKKKVSILEKGRRKVKTLSGVRDAARYMLSSTLELIDKQASSTHTTVKDGATELRAEYLSRKANPLSAVGILTGLELIDMTYRGLSPGDLCLIAGFTGVGKSMMAMNWAHNAMCSGYNVLYISLEMDVDKCRRSLACIHSGHEKFSSVAPPLNYSDIKNGSLTSSQEDFYLDHVLPSLQSDEFGDIRFEKPASLASIEDLMAISEVVNTQMEIDMIVIDYLGLVNSRLFSDYKDNLNAIVKQAKNWAMSFDNGRGVPIVTPFQTNRHGHETAKKSEGVYDIPALSHASEAERSSDLIIAIFTDDEMKAVNRVKITCLKTRDCEPFRPTHLFADYSSRIFADEYASEGFEDII